MEREELQKLIDKNFSIRDICKELDKSYSAVRHWLGKYGLKTKHRPFNVKDYTEEEKELLRIKRNKRTTVSNRNRARERKQQIIDTKFGGKCMACGYNRCSQALEFHHKNPDEKSFELNIAKLGQLSMETINDEVSKCVLLCANCHREAHYGLLDVNKL